MSDIRLPYKQMRDGRQICLNSVAGWREYNRRTDEMSERQKHLCGLCGLWMPEDDRSFDHEDGRGMGGAKRDDRTEVDGKRKNAATHCGCNVAKGSRRIPYVVQ